MVVFLKVRFIQNVLMHGGAFCKLGVADSQKIDVWKHRWLPNPSYSIINSPRDASIVVRVCDFFFPNTRVWDPSKLESCFLPWEVEMVCWIQVLETWSEDILIWPYSTNGEYSVCNAYHLLVEEDGWGLPSSSSSSDSKKFWKKLWKIWVPNRIQHFLWQAIKDSLPTKQNLNVWHVPMIFTCDCCDNHPETILNCLWLRDEARSVWWFDPGFQFLLRNKFCSFYDLVEILLNERSSYRVALFATIT